VRIVVCLCGFVDFLCCGVGALRDVTSTVTVLQASSHEGEGKDIALSIVCILRSK